MVRLTIKILIVLSAFFVPFVAFGQTASEISGVPVSSIDEISGIPTANIDVRSGTTLQQTCTLDESYDSDDAQWSFARYVNEAAIGWSMSTGMTSEDICKVIAQLSQGGGNLATSGFGGGPKKFYVSFYTQDVSNNLDAELCRSEAIDGAAWNQTNITWDGGDFVGGCDASTADVWIIWVDDDNDPEDGFDYSNTDFPVARYGNDTGSPLFDRWFFSSTGVALGGAARDTDDTPTFELWSVQ